MKKVLPLTLVLIGAALLITAVVFWIDSNTSAAPESFGKSLRDWITLIAGLGASIKGWIDLVKKEKPTLPTTKIDVKDVHPQISTGDNARNIQTQTYIERQIIQQIKETEKPLESYKTASMELSSPNNLREKNNNGSRVRFLDALDSARFSSQVIYSDSGLFSILYVKAQFFFAMITGDSIVISDNQLFDSFGFLEAFSELYIVAKDVDFEKELPVNVALRETNKDVYQVVAAHIGNKDYFLTLWKDLNGDPGRRTLWADCIRIKQKPAAEIVLAEERSLLDKLWIILEYFNPDRCINAENIPEEFSKRVKRVTELKDDILDSLCTGINMDVEQRMYFDTWSEVDAAKKIRDVLVEIQNKVGEIKSRSLIRREIAHYESEELREGVIEVTDGIYNQILGIATGATLIQSSIFPLKKSEYVAAGYSLSTYIKDTSNPFNQYVDWEVFSFDYFENLQRLDDPKRKVEMIRILEAARKNAPWRKIIEMQRNEDWQNSLKKFRDSLTKLQSVVKLYKIGSLPKIQREKLEENLSDYQVELKNNWIHHVENVRHITGNDYWNITSKEILFTDPSVYYSVRIPYSYLKPKIDMEYIDGIKNWRTHKAFKGRLDDRIDSSV